MSPIYQADVILSCKVYNSLDAEALSKDKTLSIEDRSMTGPTELELVKSSTVLSKVVEKLDLDTDNINSIPTTQSPFTFGEFNVSRKLHHEKMILRSLDATKYALEIPKEGFVKEGFVGERYHWILPNQESVNVLVNVLPIETNTVYQFSKKPRDEIINEILSNTIFEAIGIEDNLLTSLIKISYKGMNPEQITEIVNSIAESAVEVSKKEEQIQAGNALELVLIERDQAKKALDEQIKRLSQVQIHLDKLSVNEEINAQYIASQMAEIKNNICKLEAQKASLKDTITDQHPKMISIEASLKSYNDLYEKLKRNAHESLARESEILSLEKDIAIYTRIYEKTMQDYHYFKARYESPVGNLRVVELAHIPAIPISYSKPIIILLSALIGLVCGYVIALVLD